jgi:hypothetical protein
MKTIAFAAFLTIGIATAALAQQPQAPRQTPQTSPPTSTTRDAPSRSGAQPGVRDTERSDRSDPVTFESADKNQDGKLSRDEAKDVRGLKFSKADTDKDSTVSRQEFQTAMASTGSRTRG